MAHPDTCWQLYNHHPPPPPHPLSALRHLLGGDSTSTNCFVNPSDNPYCSWVEDRTFVHDSPFMFYFCFFSLFTWNCNRVCPIFQLFRLPRFSVFIPFHNHLFFVLLNSTHFPFFILYYLYPFCSLSTLASCSLSFYTFYTICQFLSIPTLHSTFPFLLPSLPIHILCFVFPLFQHVSTPSPSYHSLPSSTPFHILHPSPTSPSPPPPVFSRGVAIITPQRLLEGSRPHLLSLRNNARFTDARESAYNIDGYLCSAYKQSGRRLAGPSDLPPPDSTSRADALYVRRLGSPAGRLWHLFF